MFLHSLTPHLKRHFGSTNGITQLAQLSKNFIEHINKYKKEKIFSIQVYKNQKQKLKECFHNLFNKELNTLNEKELTILFTHSILLCRRVLISKEDLKRVLLKYISLKKYENSEDVVPLNTVEIKNNVPNKEEIVLVAKCLLYLNIEYDRQLFNYIYFEWNKVVDFYTVEELVEIVSLISSFKNKNWINRNFFARCIYEVIKKSNENSNEKNRISFFLVPLIKSCAKVGYDLSNIKTLLDLLIEHYKQGKKGKERNKKEVAISKEKEKEEEEEGETCVIKNKNNYDIHALIKVLYNLFLCNYYNSKSINPLINLLKEELFLTTAEEEEEEEKEKEEYESNKKYPFNDNLIIDNNLDCNPDTNFNITPNVKSDMNHTIRKSNSRSISICNDTLKDIHEIYFNSSKKDKTDSLKHIDSIKSISLYRLKFVNILIRSDSYLYNSFYSPNAHFWDYIKQLQYEGNPPKTSIFSKQVAFFLKENGFQMKCKQVDIYQVFVLPNAKNTCVELVHSVFVNKKMKDSPNKFHKNSLNYKFRHLKFLGWNILLFYEHEWKKLRNYDEKYIYVENTLKKLKQIS